MVMDGILLPTSGARRVRWGQLYGASPALYVAAAAAAHPGPVLVIAENARAAALLEDELRFFATADMPVERFADWETLPYDLFSPHPDITSTRLRLLARLTGLDRGLVVVDAETLLVRIAPRTFIDAHAFELAVGAALDLEAFRARLVSAGYVSASQVVVPGEFAVRGSIVDLFPMGSPTPYRIDLFGDEIETLRTFDPETQLSGERVATIRMLPAREFPLDETAIASFKRRFRTRFDGDLTQVPIYRDVSNGLAPGGIEYYLPLFFDATASLFDYLPATTLVTAPVELPQLIDRAWQQTQARYEQRRHDRERPVLAPEEICLSPTEVTSACEPFAAIEIARTELEPAAQDLPFMNFGTRAPPRLRIDPRSDSPASALLEFLDRNDGRVLLAAESAGRREMLLEMLRRRGHDAAPIASWQEFASGNAALGITVSPIASGLLLAQPPLAVIAEEQLFGERARQERRRRRADRDPEAIIRDLGDLRSGAPVVHEEYGIGRYLGLVAMAVGGMPGEFLLLEYADGDKLYVPVQSLELISRYTGAGVDQAPLHKLGGDAWQRARRKAAQRIRDTAAELLDLYSRRAARHGQSLTVPVGDLRAFEAQFPFEETPDQEQAIAEVVDDLAAIKPMDRVVCGDVGFGKTEVALRAAFVTVEAGKQVAVLVPTTLLAQQHHQTFADRFADWPVRIEQLSRFAGSARANGILAGLEAGSVDVVIGTHRLLQRGVRFRDLGLVIVDEEHRFGVKDKERLKALRADVDVLTLTATPIPRTLNMAMGGLRDLSLITTPPAARLAIKTFVSEWNATMVREACLREIRRGGQIYYVHNAVETIEKTAREVAALIPEARIAIGHGQMRERELEQVMLDFYHGRCNLLVCTTIVESGIDVPAANTIVIDRADRLGLAQLHQLRGRVGRSHHQAYAYLLTPPQTAMTADAIKRLEAIESLEDLGAGFTLATHDLEIRGAGELLGEEQSGQIQEIGFALYMDMLERAVRELKAGRIPDLDQPLNQGPEIELHVPTLLPDDYVPDVHLRLVLYKRIANAPDEEALRELQVEMIDRFGLLPAYARNLFDIAALKLEARALGIRRLDFGPAGGSFTFAAETSVDPGALIRYVQRHSKTHRFDGPDRVRFRLSVESPDKRIDAARALFAALAEGAAGPAAHAVGS
jgi:transcription-repair coupling factor (superfamily II helicase)